MITCEKKIIATTHNVASNLLSKATGLMFQKEIKKPLVFMFNKEQKISLHMFFVFFPIDVVYLTKITTKDKTSIGSISETATIIPWQCFFPKNNASIVIEFAKGTIEKYKLKTGKTVKIYQ